MATTATVQAEITRLTALQTQATTRLSNLMNNLITNETNHADILVKMDQVNTALRQLQSRLDALNTQLGTVIPDPVIP